MPDEHYTNRRLAQIYDLDSPWDVDTDFYLSLATDQSLRVLDIGCGTGTLCLGFAARGHQVTGVDPARAMLDVARAKDDGGNTVRWIESSAQAFTSTDRFDLITMTGHAFQCLLSDAEVSSAFENLAKHLAPGGQFAFESRNPNINWEEEWRRHAQWEIAGQRVRQERSKLSGTIPYLSFHHTFQFPDATFVAHSKLRFMQRQEIEQALHNAGLAVQNLYGDWHTTSFDERVSKEMIYIAQRAES